MWIDLIGGSLVGANGEKIIHAGLSYTIIGLAMRVHNTLGYGFLEKVYENALMILFQESGIKAQQQAPVKVYFEGVYFEGKVVGDYYADILVDDCIILELKALDKMIGAHKAQALNYLKATGLRLAILINFGKDRLEYERLAN